MTNACLLAGFVSTCVFLSRARDRRFISADSSPLTSRAPARDVVQLKPDARASSRSRAAKGILARDRMNGRQGGEGEAGFGRSRSPRGSLYDPGMTHGVCRRAQSRALKVNNDMRLIVICKWKISGKVAEGRGWRLMNIYSSRLATVKYSYIPMRGRMSIKRIIFGLKPGSYR